MGGAHKLRSLFLLYALNVRTSLPKADQKLIQIVDAALAETARKSGDWLACRKGCTQCCFGPFPVSQLDAVRLRQGLADLKRRDPQRAAQVRERARQAVRRLLPGFPGDPETGILAEGEDEEASFEDFANDEPCPALAADGSCDLYSARPMTCRTFGPPVRSGSEEALGVCELCYHGASDQQIAACEMVPDPDDLEMKLIAQVEKKTGKHGNTIVAFCLAK